jgi:hypothetical protein
MVGIKDPDDSNDPQRHNITWGPNSSSTSTYTGNYTIAASSSAHPFQQWCSYCGLYYTGTHTCYPKVVAPFPSISDEDINRIAKRVAELLRHQDSHADSRNCSVCGCPK